MSSPLRPSRGTPARGSAPADRAETPFNVTIVSDLMLAFNKAARAQQLYLPNNPMFHTAMENVDRAFHRLWEETDELDLAIGEGDIRWCDVPVHVDSAKGTDNLAWLLYKDGVRALRMLKDFEVAELPKLLQLVQRVRAGGGDEDDLVSMLWESDFALLQYASVDVGVEGSEGSSIVLAPRTDTPVEPGTIRAAAVSAVAESKASGLVDVAAFDGTLYFLNEKEVEYIQHEVAREYQEDLHANIVAALLDVFEQQRDESIRIEVLEHLDTVIINLLSLGKLRSIAGVLSEVEAAAGRAGKLSPDLAARLGGLPDRLSAPDALGQILQALDDASVNALPSEDDLSALLDRLRPVALETIFKWLPKIRNDRLKVMLETVSGSLATMNTSELVRLVQSPDSVVSNEAIRRASALKAQAAVVSISAVLMEPDVARRLLATKALAGIASPGALQGLLRAMDDGDREVRIAAIRSVATAGFRPGLPKLEILVRGKAPKDITFTERTAIFEGYGTLCGDGGVVHLDKILNGKGFLGRREDPEVRACAAVGLGKIGTANALDALQRASGDSEVTVRTAVTRALRGQP